MTKETLPRLLRLPPVIALAFLLVGLAVNRVLPLSLGVPSFTVGMSIGSGILLTAVAMAWNALSQLKQHQTTVEPEQRPTALVTSGVFSFTRNPLYVTLLLILLSLAVMIDSLSLAVATALLGYTLDRAIIRAEEKILEEEFPHEYPAYKSRVGRWV